MMSRSNAINIYLSRLWAYLRGTRFIIRVKLGLIGYSSLAAISMQIVAIAPFEGGRRLGGFARAAW